MPSEKTQAQAFLLINPAGHGGILCQELRASRFVVWAAQSYGPYPIVAYAAAESHEALTEFIESLRGNAAVQNLDARMCKHIPGDEDLQPPKFAGPEMAVLLINVNYTIEKERVVTYRLRENRQVKLARAMWGPSDIVAVVEANDHESMRNLICDEIKVLKGVATNTTLYCYPKSC